MVGGVKNAQIKYMHIAVYAIYKENHEDKMGIKSDSL